VTPQERAKEGHCKLEESERAAAAAVLGYGGVKYFDLRQNRLSDYELSYERMLSPDGDTAVYLEVCPCLYLALLQPLALPLQRLCVVVVVVCDDQYAHARLNSIIRKAEQDTGVTLSQVQATSVIELQHPSEVALVAEITRFQVSSTCWVFALRCIAAL
jgi:arginyl-tRNA synthetase